MAEEKAKDEKQEAGREEKREAKKEQKPQPRPLRIVRLLGTDIDSSLSLRRALRRIKGLGFMFSNAACIAAGVDAKKPLSDLSAEEIRRIEDFVKQPQLPQWMLNRRKNEAGDAHAIMSELDLRVRDDINLLRRMRAYRGIRHEMGQPVRGQRTRGSFRTNRSVGVSKKKLQAAAQAAKKEEKK